MTDHEDRIPPPNLEDVLDMGIDALELVRFRLEDERDSIQHQLELDAIRRAEAEEEQDAYWVARARHAVRCRITRIQQIGRILKIREEVA